MPPQEGQLQANGTSTARENGSAEKEPLCTLIQPLRSDISRRLLRVLIQHEPPKSSESEICGPSEVIIESSILDLQLRTTLSYADRALSGENVSIVRNGQGFVLNAPVDPAKIVQALLDDQSRGIPLSLHVLGEDLSGVLVPSKGSLITEHGVQITHQKNEWILSCPVPGERLLALFTEV